MSAEPNIQSDLSESARAAFTDAYLKHLAPENPVEETLAIEIVAAAWRLRRCGIVEAQFPGSDNTEALQRSVDQARNQAHRLFVKSVAELGKLQTERQFRFEALPESQTDPGLVSFRDVIRDLGAQVNWRLAVRRLEGDPIANFINAPMPGQSTRPHAEPPAVPEVRFVNSENTPATPSPSHPRNALCPCGSNEKYKRCCGRTAPGQIHSLSPQRSNAA